METPGNYRAAASQALESLKQAAAEIDELRVQTQLGKAEAAVAFEALKKQFHSSLQLAEATMKQAGGEDRRTAVLNALEFLRVQLSLGRAETNMVFEAQQDKLNSAMAKLQAAIKKEKSVVSFSDQLNLEIEKFRIKLELLGLHFKLDKLALAHAYDEKSRELSEKIVRLKAEIVQS